MKNFYVFSFLLLSCFSSIGQNYTISGYVSKKNRVRNSSNEKYGVLKFNKTSFDYIISKDLYQDNNENPFSTPINVRSNIVNGYGNIELAHYVRLN
jgi:hypothetical protein